MVKKSNKKRIMVIALGIMMAGILGLGAVTSSQFYATQSKQSVKFGGLGSAHVHAAFLIKLDGEILDFSHPKYQIRSPYIHVEDANGFTLHRHALSVPMGEFLNSVSMDIKNGCFISDDGKDYCSEGAKKLRFFVNEAETGSILDYVLQENDRILIVYGQEDQEALSKDLEFVNNLEIFRNG